LPCHQPVIASLLKAANTKLLAEVYPLGQKLMLPRWRYQLAPDTGPPRHGDMQ